MKFWRFSRLSQLMLILMILPMTALAVTVHDIQYTEDASGDSPLLGQIVTVTGIVTGYGYYSSGNSNRFFVSDPEGGAWSGVFCFNYDYIVSVGDEVEFTAEVDEYYGFTELKNLNNLEILSSGNELPAPVEVSTNDIANEEMYEGCLVKVSEVDVSDLPNNYGEWYVDDGSGECQIDDSFSGYSNPNISSSDVYYSIVGLVDYSYDNYGINPRTEDDLILMGMPVVEEIYTDPEFPVVGEVINVIAKIIDYGGVITDAEISWRTVTTESGDWETSTMQPAPGDLYSYELPALSDASHYYEYTIWAEDDDNNEIETSVGTIEVIADGIVLQDISLVNSPDAGESLLVDAVLIDASDENLSAWLLYTKDYSADEYLVAMLPDSADENLFHGEIEGMSSGTELFIGVYAQNESQDVYYYDQLSYMYPAKDHKAVLKVEPKPFDPYQRDSDPENDTILIEFLAQRGDRAVMRIYNAEGKLMLTPENKVVTDNDGYNSYEWDGRDKYGELLPWGLYICHLEVMENDSGDVKTAQVPIVIGGPLK